MNITATVYKSPLDLKKVEEMITAGADVLRVKFAHVSYEEAVEVCKQVKGLIDRLKTNTEILADLPEFKVRLGGLKRSEEKVDKNKTYTLRPAKFSRSIDKFIPVNVNDFKNYFQVGDRITIGDGEVWFEVLEIISDQEVKIKFPDGGFVDQYRSLMSHRLADDLDHCYEAVESLKLFENVKPERLALSFVDCPSYIDKIKKEIKNIYGESWKPKIVAKIESPQGLLKIEEIVDKADEIVIARGDLGLTTDYCRLILEQKKVCLICKKKNIPVTVATQILESVLQRAVPARSEIGDLTNMVLDGVTGIWLSQETSLHSNPGQVVKIAKNIINTIEDSYEI